MPIRRKLASFFGLSFSDRLMVLEAIVMLGLSRLVVLTTPFRVLAPWLSRAPDTPHCDAVLIKRVRNAVTIAAGNVPWNAVCLPQAMAAKAMLARRGHGSVFHMGAAFDPNGKLIAHAWLVAGGTVVVGGSGMQGMAPLARFG